MVTSSPQTHFQVVGRSDDLHFRICALDASNFDIAVSPLEVNDILHGARRPITAADLLVCFRCALEGLRGATGADGHVVLAALLSAELATAAG